MGEEPEIEAAGGVVLRRDGERWQVVVVHRPRYDDWTLPKGKLDSGEPAERGALREVEEETGLRCELGRELPEVRYGTSNGRAKRVRYWVMHPASGRVEDRPPDREVDEVCWVSTSEAARLLSYRRDRGLLDAALALT
jgi:8-oxo-dGTP pyrophosphatase MutT (NUDIX family)